jgi:hypothetical protein
VRASKVFRARAARLAAMVSAAVVATTMFAGVASAAPPNWVMTVTTVPGEVTPGAPAGYDVTITNNGPSNISQLYLVARVNGKTNVPTAFVGTPSQGTCSPGGQVLLCTFGALNAGQSVTVRVGYGTPSSGSSSQVEFEGSTSGTSFTDPGRSHGDLLLPNPAITSTILNSNKNFGGFFSTDGTNSGGNSDQLNGNNKQSTRITGLIAGFDGTVSDGSVTPDACLPNTTPGVDCTLIDGETSVVNVNGGVNVPGGFFVIIHYKNGTTPTGFVHTFSGPGGPQEKINACADPAHPTAPCFTWDPVTTTAAIFTLHNGSYTKLH